MSPNALLDKYIRNSEKVLTDIKVKQEAAGFNSDKLLEVIEQAKRYLSDAKYYAEKKQFETGLVSVAYCEGLLDALRLLDTVEFTWPNSKENP
jgi:FAD synthetase